MHDPWDVTGTRRSDQYVSCMKINGVPLLPPLISKECRKEMQYYKTLALEVEKRISILKSVIEDSDYGSKIESSNDYKEIKDKAHEHSIEKSDSDDPALTADDYQSSSSITIKENSENILNLDSPKMVIGVLSDAFKETLMTCDNNNADTPERDYNCHIKTDKLKNPKNDNKENNSINCKIYDDEIPLKCSPTVNISKNVGSNSLVNSKSFDDIHAELNFPNKLVRQRSYTILKPGPELLAHLEVRSLATGVEMSTISMSESCSNLTQFDKKRKSWDLETAKEKWSSMATEICTKTDVVNKRTHFARQSFRSEHPGTRTRSLVVEKARRNSIPVCRTRFNNVQTTPKKPKIIVTNESPSPIKKDNINPIVHVTPSSNAKQTHKETADVSFKLTSPNVEKETTDNMNVNCVNKTKISANDSENFNSILPSIIFSPNKAGLNKAQDPTACIRELYEKIRQQQILRMASLIEKQKKEQQLLEQLFEEQNALFYKQVKTICPMSPKEIKEAWTEKTKSEEPVSLSQLIDGTMPNDKLSTTLNDTQTFLNKTEEILQKSRKVRQNSATKPKTDNLSPYAASIRPKSAQIVQKERSGMIRTAAGQTLRKHFTSESSCKSEGEPILSDRTDNTMADLNFTLTSDENGDYCSQSVRRDCTFIMDDKNENSSESKSQRSEDRRGSIQSSVESSRKSRDCSVVIHSPKNCDRSEKKSARKLFTDKPPTEKEKAAASLIVAHARGYLTRRLLRTERVQATVQTIRDALVCAVQLHQERGGLRGADIDLHRRLIQQITAACYSLHDTFVESTPRQRCALIAQDRERLRSLEEKQMSGSFSRPNSTPSRRSGRRKSERKNDIMSHSHSGVLGARPVKVNTPTMAISSHEMYLSSNYRQTPKRSLADSKEYQSRKPWR